MSSDWSTVHPLTRVTATLPRHLRQHLPPIKLLATPPAKRTELLGWYNSDTGVVVIPTYTTIFRQAAQGDANATLQLGAILVHELTHHTNGPSEAAAHDAEIAYLESQNAPKAVMDWAVSAKTDGIRIEQEEMDAALLAYSRGDYVTYCRWLNKRRGTFGSGFQRAQRNAQQDPQYRLRTNVHLEDTVTTDQPCDGIHLAQPPTLTETELAAYDAPDGFALALRAGMSAEMSADEREMLGCYADGIAAMRGAR